jgi:hypothetical protein
MHRFWYLLNRMVVKKEMILKRLVSAHSEKNHAVPFSLDLKSALQWIFIFCLVIGVQTVQAQHQVIFYTQDFGSGTVNYTSATLVIVLSPCLTNYTAITAWGNIPNDGYYAISTKSQNGGDGFSMWIDANEHTASTGTGRMMIVNANFAKNGLQSGSIIGLPLSAKAVPSGIYGINIYAANVFISGDTADINTNGSGTNLAWLANVDI